MTDEAFTNFEEEFQTLSAALGRKLQAVEEGDPKASRLLEEADDDVYQINQAMQKIEQEVRHYPYGQKSKATTRLAQLRKELEAQQRTLQQLKNGGGAGAGAGGRGGAGGSGNGSDGAAWREQRHRLLGAKQTLDESDDSLRRTQQALEDTIERGAATTATLEQQREQLLEARDTIRETDDFLTKSSKTLRRMKRRIVTNKILQAVIILVELALIALIVWLKYLKD